MVNIRKSFLSTDILQTALKKKYKRIIKSHPDKDIKFILQDGRGKGDAVRKGFSVATRRYSDDTRCGLTVPPEDLPKFYKALVEDHGEFINGCRLVYPMERQAMRFLNYLGNKFFSMMFTWILNQRFKDTLCGTKALFKKDYDKIQANRSYFGDFDPFGDFDLIFGAVKQNLKVVEVPIRYQGEDLRHNKHQSFSPRMVVDENDDIRL